LTTAALPSVFAQETAEEIESRWDDLAASLAERFPKDHWRKIWSTNLLERVNEEIKRRTRVVGIFPNDAAITRQVGAVLLEHYEHWQLEGRRMFSAKSMGTVPELGAPPALQAAGSCDPWLHRPPQLTTYTGSHERLDSSIVSIPCGYNRCICTSGMTARHSILFTLRSGHSGLRFYTTQRDAGPQALAATQDSEHGINLR
jgi:hypothetical protein